MKDTLTKVFSDISSLGHKNVPVMKEEVETINFSCYKDVNNKKILLRKWSEFLQQTM